MSNKTFKVISKSRWEAFSNLHLKHYDGDKRNYNELKGVDRLFLRTDIKQEDGCVDLIAVSMEDLETGIIKHTIREDIIDDWNSVCDKLGI